MIRSPDRARTTRPRRRRFTSSAFWITATNRSMRHGCKAPSISSGITRNGWWAGPICCCCRRRPLSLKSWEPPAPIRVWRTGWPTALTIRAISSRGSPIPPPPPTTLPNCGRHKMSAPIDAAQFRAAMARFPGAVTIVTALSGSERRGITATAVCSVTADPPSLLVCLNRKTGTCAAVRESGMFNVNLLPDAASPIALRFAGAGGVTGEEIRRRRLDSGRTRSAPAGRSLAKFLMRCGRGDRGGIAFDLHRPDYGADAWGSACVNLRAKPVSPAAGDLEGKESRGEPRPTGGGLSPLPPPMRRGHPRRFLIDAGQQIKRAGGVGQPRRKPRQILNLRDQQAPPHRTVIIRHLPPALCHLIGDARPPRALADHQPRPNQLAQTILDVRHIIAVGHPRQFLDRFWPLVHADDVQHGIFRPRRGQIDHRGQTLRLPTTESLEGPHQRKFKLGRVHLGTALRQMPAIIHSRLLPIGLSFHDFFRHAPTFRFAAKMAAQIR